MVAEPVTETELPTTEVADVTTPESIEQPEVEIDDTPEEAVSAFLREQKILADGTSEGDGDGSSTNADGPDLSKLTPQQILDLGKLQGKSETLTEAQAATVKYQNQQRVEGARNTLSYSKTNLTQLLSQAGYDANTVIQATQFQDQLHGAWNLVYQADVAAAETRASENYSNFVQTTAAAVLGTTKGKGLTSEWAALPDAEKSSAKFFELYAEKAREGYLSPKEADEKVTKAVTAFMRKLPKEAKDVLGFNPSSTKAGAASSGAGLTYKQILKMNPKQIEQLDPEVYAAAVATG